MNRKDRRMIGLVTAVLLTLSGSALADEPTRPAMTRAAKTSLARVCPKISNLSGLLVKVTAGGHIPRWDPRNSGFSLICASRCVPWPATVYHCDGSVAFRMGYYGRWVGNGKARGYCGAGGQGACPTSSVRVRNRRLGCKGAAFLAEGRGRCMRFNVNSNRNGSV